MKCLLMTAVLILASTAHAETQNPEEEKCCCTEDQKVKTSFPPLKTGFLVDLDPKGRDGFFYLGLEVADGKIGQQQFSLDLGVASSRVLLGLAWTPLFDNKVGPFLWSGYNISKRSAAFGFGLTVLKL